MGSAATLPVTTTCAVEKNGIPKDLAKFVLSVGATMNMDGSAIYFPIQVFFVAATQGIRFSFGQMITMSIVSSLTAMGASPIPSMGLVFLLPVLKAVGIAEVGPMYGLLIAIDWLPDRPITMTNIVGDSFAVGVMNHFFGAAVEEEAGSCKMVSVPSVPMDKIASIPSVAVEQDTGSRKVAPSVQVDQI